MKTLLALALVATLSLPACASDPAARGADRPSPGATAHSSARSAGAEKESKKKQRFDRLTMSLGLRSHEVAPGRKIGSTVTVKNETRRPITDPGCALYAYSFALVPADQSDAELWGQVVVDCAGRRILKPGYAARYAGPTFSATDKYGAPLPAGEYLAMMELQYRSKRFSEPVTITE